MHDDNERPPAGIVATYSRYIQAPKDYFTKRGSLENSGDGLLREGRGALYVLHVDQLNALNPSPWREVPTNPQTCYRLCKPLVSLACSFSVTFVAASSKSKMMMAVSVLVVRIRTIDTVRA
jgi:hypothetical protein